MGYIISLALAAAASIGFSRVLRYRAFVDLGDDGLTLRTDEGQQFIPYDHVEDLTVELRDRSRLGPIELRWVLHLTHRGISSAIAGPERKIQRIVKAIRGARERHRDIDGAADTSALKRGSRDAASWLDDLLALGSGARSTYRTAPPPREHLWRIVESPATRPSHRAAAAIALGALHKREAKRLEKQPPPTAGLWTPHGAAKTLPGTTPDLWLATLTPVTPTFPLASPIAILWVTDETVWLTIILSHGTIGGETWARLEGDDLQRFQRQVVPRAEAIAVTADKATPLHRVRTVLGWLADAKGEVAFATAVEPPKSKPGPPGDTLAEVDRRNPPKGTCPLGITDVPAGKTPGDVGMKLFKAHDRFKRALRDKCASKLPASSAGGEVGISMRILAKGNVSEACIKSDYIGSAPLRECLRSQARAFKFPALSEGDFANVTLGVEFQAAIGRIRPLCD